MENHSEFDDEPQQEMIGATRQLRFGLQAVVEPAQ